MAAGHLNPNPRPRPRPNPNPSPNPNPNPNQVLGGQARAAQRVAERVARARAAAGAGRKVAHSCGAQLQSAGPAAELRT